MVISVEEWKGWEWGFELDKVYRRMNLALHRWQCILRRQEIGFPNSKVLFLFRLLYNIEQSSLCYTIGPCWLSVVKFFHEIFFLCEPFLKSLLNLWQYCFCFMFWYFGQEACETFVPQPGIKPAPPALEGKVLTIGPPARCRFST